MDRTTPPLMLLLMAVSWTQDLVVFQPNSTEAIKGDSVTLSCSYSSTSKPKVGSYRWVKEPDLEVKSASPAFRGRLNRTSEESFLLRRRADIEIRGLRLSDSGIYRCGVHLVEFQEVFGKGTKLQVTEPVFQVSQPSSAQGTEDGSVTLHCSYKTTSQPKVASYRWLKDPGVEVRNTTWEFMGRVAHISDEDFLSKRRADIEIHNLNYNDSGMYRCMVDILGRWEMAGNGTLLQVVKKTTPKSTEETPQHQVRWPMPLAARLGSALVVFVALGLTFLYCRKRRGYVAEASKEECHRPDHDVDPVLNYAELTMKEGQTAGSQRDTIAYGRRERRDQYC